VEDLLRLLVHELDGVVADARDGDAHPRGHWPSTAPSQLELDDLPLRARLSEKKDAALRLYSFTLALDLQQPDGLEQSLLDGVGHLRHRGPTPHAKIYYNHIDR
jgi:hypothetical protein